MTLEQLRRHCQSPSSSPRLTVLSLPVGSLSSFWLVSSPVFTSQSGLCSSSHPAPLHLVPTHLTLSFGVQSFAGCTQSTMVSPTGSTFQAAVTSVLSCRSVTFHCFAAYTLSLMCPLLWHTSAPSSVVLPISCTCRLSSSLQLIPGWAKLAPPCQAEEAAQLAAAPTSVAGS